MQLWLMVAIAMTLTLGCASRSPLGEGRGGQLGPLIVEAIDTARLAQSAQIVIQASRPFSYNLSNHEKPPRVLVQIPDAQFAKLAPHMAVHKGVVQTIDLQEREGAARMEIVLDRLLDYEVEKHENRLVLRFKDVSATGEPGAGRDRSRSAVMPAPPSHAIEPSATALLRPERHAPAPKEVATSTAGGAPPNPLEYVIGARDALEINVYQEKDLSGTFGVSADGKIFFPLLGDVRIVGLTPPQTQEKLEGLLRDGYLKRPQVSVSVKEYRSKGVSVLGGVANPGTYQLWGGRTTLLELIAMAGGVNLEAGSKSLILVRPDDSGETKSITIDLDRLLKEGDASQNMLVQPNDAIYVTKADAIIVYGEVKSPGTYPLESKGMTVLEALSKAGGLTQYAAPNRTRIMRVEGGVEKSIRVRLGNVIAGERMKDVILQSGDVIVVPESYF